MGNEIQYVIVFATVNGTLLAQEQDIQVHRTTNAIPVSTVARGYSGESPGAGMINITISSAVPQGGFEFNAGPNMAGLIPAKIYVVGPGGQQLKSTAMVYEDSFGHGVNKAATYSFSARAPLSDWS